MCLRRLSASVIPHRFGHGLGSEVVGVVKSPDEMKVYHIRGGFLHFDHFVDSHGQSIKSGCVNNEAASPFLIAAWIRVSFLYRDFTTAFWKSSVK